MKKAKMMLTALAILTVVGGALAFKSKHFNGNLICAAASGLCPTIPPIQKYTASPSGQLKFCAPLGSVNCTVSTRVIPFE